MNINNYKDEELIFLFRLKSDEAFNVLHARYKRKASYLVDEIVENLKANGVEKAALIYVCLETLKKCIENFTFGREKFHTFWRTCARRKVLDYLLENSYLNKAKQYVGISLDSYIVEDDPTSNTLSNIIASPEDDSDDLSKSMARLVEEDTSYLKTRLEKDVFLWYLDEFPDHSVSEIMKTYKITKSKAYRIIKRGQELLKKVYLKQ